MVLGSRPLVGLVRACHPGPTVAVTAVTTLLASSVGRSGAGLLLVAGAVLAGQLSVGWSNDAHDAAADTRATRPDKPVVAGQVTADALWTAAIIALAVTAVLSVAVGPLAGSLHLVAVASAWSYNLGIARTAWSFLPYVVAFALLPAFVATAGDPPSAPAAWAVTGFASLGLGAHLVNGIRDLEVDRGLGWDGAAVRLGAARGRMFAALAFVVAAGALGTGLREASPLIAWVVPVGSVLVLVPSVWLASPRTAFRAVLVTAVALVTVLVLVALAGEVTITAS